MPRFRQVASMLTVGAGVASLSVISATAAGADNSSTSNSNNNNDNTTQSNSASTSGACSPVQQQNNRSIDNSNDVRGGDGGDGGNGGNGANPPRRVMLEAAAKPGQGNANIPILSPGTGNGNGSGGNGGNGGNGGPAHGSANAGNQFQVVSNCGNTTVNPVRTVVVTRTVTVQAGAPRAVTSTAHFTG